MSPRLLATCWLLVLLPAAAPSTVLNVQLDPARPTQLYRAPSNGGGPGAWIITGSNRHRPAASQASYSPAAATAATAAAVKRRPVAAAAAGASAWTYSNRVEEPGERPGASGKPVRLPSFVVTSRPFGFQGGSSGQGQRRPVTQAPATGHGTGHGSGQGSGQAHSSSSQGQLWPPVKSYVRPSRPRPRPTSSSGFNSPAADSFIFSPSGDQRPSPDYQRQPPVQAGAVQTTRPSQTSYRPSSQFSSNVNSPSAAGHDSGDAQPADAEPLPAPPSANDDTTVTRKTTPDAVSTVGGKKLPTFNLGCRQGHRCSFIINAPTHVPQPTYTPYNKQTVDSYLQRFQTLLAISNSRQQESSGSSATASSEGNSDLASASSNVASVVAAAPAGFNEADAAGGDIYNDNRATAVPSPGEAYREDIRRRAAAPEPALTHRASADSGAALVAQRYRPGTADLYRIMRASPSTLRTVRPAEAAYTGASSASQWQPAAAQWSGHREAKNVQSFALSSVNDEKVKGESESSAPGRRYSRYTVERVDPKTQTSYPTSWSSDNQNDNHVSSNVVPVTGTIFKAHLSSGPIQLQPKTGVKRSRSEGSFFQHSPVAAQNPSTASIITADGVREVPNVMNREFRRRQSDARQYRPSSYPASLQMARKTRHYAAPPSRYRPVRRWRGPTLSSRMLHK